MKITILTLFPEMFAGPFDHSIIKRVKEKGLVEIEFVNIRDFGLGKHKVIDDSPYGGGLGMVMRVDVVSKAISNVKCQISNVKCNEKVVLLTASGKQFKQEIAQSYSELDHLILICGHYEGVDDRIRHYIDEEISIGDFVLTGGEIPAMLIADAVTRLLPGAITEGSVEDESFSQKDELLLEYPHYTKPQEYDGHKVPEILLSGNHPKIGEWRREKAVEKTKAVRPELLNKNKS
jgi:tRNA (guanine37-N1)-methyltransferase